MNGFVSSHSLLFHLYIGTALTPLPTSHSPVSLWSLSIERMDERRRQRTLRDEAAASGEAELKQQHIEAVGQGGPPVLRSDSSTLSNSSDSTSASLREKARRLQQEALLNRDRATCVRGAQQSFRLKVAEMREQEAARLLAMAEAADEGVNQAGSVGPLSPAGSDANMTSARGPLMSDIASLPNMHSPRGAHLQRQQYQQHPPQQEVYGDVCAYQREAARGSEASGIGRDGALQQQVISDTPREQFEGHATLMGKPMTTGVSMPSQADQALAEEAAKLRKEALLCRDKALCCTGAKQRQLISLAELKERRAADAIALMSDPGLHCHQRGEERNLQVQQTPRRAAGELRGRVNPRGDSGIFDS
ncbi:hypothetical protein cyc_01021 [Cyclospora cayetanensis]|uniref:Uncharacterized protein n=1 Tax=Cyclospora cayetanensis TaxID=88456 RepID=A0A1D3CWG4_9EIME|nr:hypothetical protein cyc_01021 [Cyclospora cayetanensis]